MQGSAFGRLKQARKQQRGGCEKSADGKRRGIQASGPANRPTERYTFHCHVQTISQRLRLQTGRIDGRGNDTASQNQKPCRPTRKVFDFVSRDDNARKGRRIGENGARRFAHALVKARQEVIQQQNTRTEQQRIRKRNPLAKARGQCAD